MSAKLPMCAMCGANDNDVWETQPGRPVILQQHPRFGDTTQIWTLCEECEHGLQNTALPKPDRVHLLSQVRRATLDDQSAVLNWLLQKFNLEATQKPKIKGK